MSDRYTKMVAWRLTTVEMVHFIMDTPGNGAESKTKNLFREEGDAESDPANVSGSDNDYIRKKVLRR